MSRFSLNIVKSILIFLGLLLATGGVSAQKDYPTKPIRIIIPYAPGGIADTVARIIAPMFQDALNQTVIIESKTGASGTVGTAFVAKSPPDGYTLLLGLAAPQTLSQHLGKIEYDGVKDFAPITLINTNPLVLLVNPSLPINSVADLIKYAKANPGKLNFSGAGGLTQFAGEIFKARAGINMIHVPYRGGAPAVTAAVAGETQLTFANYSDAIPWIESGKLRPLGVTSASRFALAPKIPAISETLPGFAVEGWSGLFAPAGTPPEIVNRLASIVRDGYKDPALRKRMESIGATPGGDTPEEFRAFVRAESVKWGNFVTQTGIKGD
jgi:tripartite-type tricarboxylate transporter receptor subunit TctC